MICEFQSLSTQSTIKLLAFQIFKTNISLNITFLPIIKKAADHRISDLVTVQLNLSTSHKGSLDLFDAFLGLKLHLFDAFRPLKLSRAFLTISGPWNRQNMSVSGASMSQKGPVLFQEPESFKKVQFQAKEIFNFCLILEFENKLLRLI